MPNTKKRRTVTRAKKRVDFMLDAIDEVLAECDVRQLNALKQYAFRMTTTNCAAAQYWLRTFLIEYIPMEISARAISRKSNDA